MQHWHAMTTAQSKPHLDRLVMLPIIGALVLICVTVAAYTISQRRGILAETQRQLAATVSTLADFNELAEQATGDAVLKGSESRSAAIWRALLQYPSASIWVEKDGVVTAGQPPAVDLADSVVADDVRANFTIHAAMPSADALTAWRRSAMERGIVMLVFCAVLLVLTQFLIRALRQRASAEREIAAAEERAAQQALYRLQLEQTVTERTADLQQAKGHLEKELIERKAAEAQLREHDALLNAVTKSAAELLGTQHDDAIAMVLELIGQTIGVGRVQLSEVTMHSDGHLHSMVRYEWCAPGAIATIDNPALQNIDLNKHLPRSIGPSMTAGAASFFIADVSGTYRGLFEQARMRSFLELPVMLGEKLWGSLNFIDSSTQKREWSWAETDTLKTLAGLIGTAIARARYVQELADANMIVQNSPTILYRLKGEPSLPLIYISHNITKFGHDPRQLVGRANWSEAIIDAEDAPKVNAAMSRALDKDAQAASIEFRFRTGDGGYRWVENRYTPVRDKDGRLSEIEGIVIDITERKQAEDKIALLARTDALTGLANRASFLDRLRQTFAASKRGATPFAVLYMDLDHFKDVNDTLGHPAGDALLRQVSARLKSVTRETDLIARLGGDEFAIIQGEMSEPSNAGALAGKIVKAIGAPYDIDGHQVHVTASIGICPYTAGSASPDAMLAQADLALYRSKDEGRNCYHFHSDDLDRQVLERVTLADDLRKALENDELELYYQPQVDVVSGNIVGMEALVRWNHPARGLLRAGEFIPMAEKAGLTSVLGHWVLDQACRQLHHWKLEGMAPAVIAVNLSVSQLRSGGELISDVEACLQRWEVTASELEFDVTEATLAQITLMQSDVLQRLRALGVRIAIDDFGTEYSSFEYLRTYHVSHLKIAQDFVRTAIDDPDRAATIRAIMNIARELDIGVIAEGVETEDQRRMLAATGSTTSAQGYYFSEAVDLPHASELLRKGTVGALIERDDDAITSKLLLEAGHKGP